jgi:hypothetical protein
MNAFPAPRVTPVGTPTSPSRRDCLVCAAATLLAPTGLWAAPAPRQLQWDYEIKGKASGFSYQARASWVWQREANRYTLTQQLSVPLLGSQTQTSQGIWRDPQGPEPRQFSDSKRTERNVAFEPEQGQLRFLNSSARAPWAPGAQDRLSLFLALMQHSQSLKAPTPGQRWACPVASSRGLDAWHFECLGSASLALPAGQFTAWAWERTQLPAGESTLKVWLSPQAGWGPVRVLITEPSGNQADQRLSQFKTNA